MPQRNSRKTYVELGHYHIYNRGVEKRTIFASPLDYKVFLGYLREYLSPPIINDNKDENLLVQNYYRRKSYADVIRLEAYVLMPNHFHLLIRQKNSDAMKQFLQSLCTRYSVYFNKQHDRVGSLFQGRYKAVMVKTDEQLVHLSRYIHLNPTDLGVSVEQLDNYPYSSFPNYLGKRDESWVNPEGTLSLFRDLRSGKPAERQYRKFVENHANSQPEIIQRLTLEES
jgi:putative transposase